MLNMTLIKKMWFSLLHQFREVHLSDFVKENVNIKVMKLFDIRSDIREDNTNNKRSNSPERGWRWGRPQRGGWGEASSGISYCVACQREDPLICFLLLHAELSVREYLIDVYLFVCLFCHSMHVTLPLFVCLLICLFVCYVGPHCAACDINFLWRCFFW